MMTKKIAFIIGNGSSRNPIDLNLLSSSGKTYGCNALYRDFVELDYLIAIDDGMIEEIRSHNFTDTNTSVIIPTENDRWESAEYNTQRRRNNAGMCAMNEAIRHGSNMLYCLGFDFVLSGDISVDNLYKDTPNYGVETQSNESDNLYRVKYLKWFAEKNKNTTFVMVIPDDAAVNNYINHLGELGNIIFMRTATFLNKLESE